MWRLASGHSRGGAVDLTLYHLATGELAPMGGDHDLMDSVSHHETPGITEPEAKNRRCLRLLMEASGFDPYDREWWHYSLRHEPYPNTYFDFPVAVDYARDGGCDDRALPASVDASLTGRWIDPGPSSASLPDPACCRGCLEPLLLFLFRAQLGVLPFQIQDHADPAEVEAGATAARRCGAAGADRSRCSGGCHRRCARVRAARGARRHAGSALPCRRARRRW